MAAIRQTRQEEKRQANHPRVRNPVGDFVGHRLVCRPMENLRIEDRSGISRTRCDGLNSKSCERVPRERRKFSTVARKPRRRGAKSGASRAIVALHPAIYARPAGRRRSRRRLYSDSPARKFWLSQFLHRRDRRIPRYARRSHRHRARSCDQVEPARGAAANPLWANQFPSRLNETVQPQNPRSPPFSSMWRPTPISASQTLMLYLPTRRPQQPEPFAISAERCWSGRTGLPAKQFHPKRVTGVRIPPSPPPL